MKFFLLHNKISDAFAMLLIITMILTILLERERCKEINY